MVVQVADTGAALGYDRLTVNTALVFPALPSTTCTSPIEICGTSSFRIVPTACVSGSVAYWGELRFTKKRLVRLVLRRRPSR